MAADISTFQKTKDNITIFLVGLVVLGIAEMRIEIAKQSAQLSVLPLMEYRIKQLEKINGIAGPIGSKLPYSEKEKPQFEAIPVDNRVSAKYFTYRNKKQTWRH